MTPPSLFASLLVALSAALLLAAGPSFAADGKAAAAGVAANASTQPGAAASANGSTAKAGAAPAGKAAAKPAAKQAAKPPVDINSATLTELKTLPGIRDAEAAKIVAGRPYGSKAQLETRKILDSAVYDGLKQHVIARQPKAAGAAPAAGKTTP
jgi:DNA uptake protein ComE-like DNA-binding protein